jgi:starch-binding outer membrane protein, SusD/RagB family
MKKMKTSYHILITILALFLIIPTSCEDQLDLVPKDELSEATIFESYNNIRSYSWSFYEFLEGYPASGTWAATRDLEGDLMENGASSVSPSYLNNLVTIPTQSSTWTDSYSNIRKVNIMLDKLKTSKISDADKTHWRGVGLFFRSHEYFKLLTNFGGVPWIENALTDADTDILYGPRNSRDDVAANLLRDLQEAITSIKETGDGLNTVNKDVARALLSRFALFEGTWRKYHNLPDPDKYLKACVEASAAIVTKFPTLHPSYDQEFNSADLNGVRGILLYKAYVIDELVHWASTNTRSTNNKYGITRRGVDMFLTKNGMPVRNASNTQFQGDKDFFAEFRDRDTRLLINTPPPYRVNGDGANTFTSTGVPANEEYFPILKAITTGFPYKELPDRNWSGRVTGTVPNFTGLAPTQTGGGYRFWKVYNDHNNLVSSRDISDCPLFRVSEVMLNYAEASFELGQFTQAIADATINKLRARGQVAPLSIAAITADWDPTRDASVAPLLWEIRRERGVELMGDGFRREDLRRWKKMDWAVAPKLGRWIKASNYTQKINIQDNAPEGYVQLVLTPRPAFPEHYYLFPLPSQELVLNPNLKQNPGW